MKKILFLLIFLPFIGVGQNNFYLGAGMISSFANTEDNNNQYTSNNLSDFGLYYGNDLIINDYLKAIVEVFYLNNRVALSRNGNKKFELHQNIGFGLLFTEFESISHWTDHTLTDFSVLQCAIQYKLY